MNEQTRSNQTKIVLIQSIFDMSASKRIRVCMRFSEVEREIRKVEKVTKQNTIMLAFDCDVDHRHIHKLTTDNCANINIYNPYLQYLLCIFKKGVQ